MAAGSLSENIPLFAAGALAAAAAAAGPLSASLAPPAMTGATIGSNCIGST
jgi:hypothetical protein